MRRAGSAPIRDRVHEADPPPEKMATVVCAKCGFEFLTINGHAWAICWHPEYPAKSCGWFLRIYPEFGKLYSDPVLFVQPKHDGSCKATLVHQAIRMVRDYWVQKGIAQVVQEEGKTGIRLAGKHWDYAGPEAGEV
jgi:hypothetical protein